MHEILTAGDPVLESQKAMGRAAAQPKSRQLLAVIATSRKSVPALMRRTTKALETLIDGKARNQTFENFEILEGFFKTIIRVASFLNIGHLKTK